MEFKDMEFKDIVGCVTGIAGLLISLLVFARSISVEKKKNTSDLLLKKRLAINGLSSLQTSFLMAQREIYSLKNQAEDDSNAQITDITKTVYESCEKQDIIIKKAFEELRKDIPTKTNKMKDLDAQLEKILSMVAEEGAALQIQGATLIDPAKRNLDLRRRAREKGIVLPPDNP